MCCEKFRVNIPAEKGEIAGKESYCPGLAVQMSGLYFIASFERHFLHTQSLA
jgi:hypothetical protein